MTDLTDYAKQRQEAYRETRRAWALSNDRPYPEDGDCARGACPILRK